jgi:hypothetical protein
MKLKIWMAINEISPKELAEFLEIQVRTLYGVMNGSLRAGGDLAECIEKTTKGEVTQKEIFSLYRGSPLLRGPRQTLKYQHVCKKRGLVDKKENG